MWLTNRVSEGGENVSVINRYLAIGTLGATSLLYFAALPFEGSFGGGLAVSVFGAAMVGGLADWFAVSALFRKPLGISWRTAVIPRNRERLFAVIVQMVQDELLSKENIRRKIEGYDLSRVILAYLDERGGAKTVKRMLHKLVSDVLDKVDPHEAGQFIANFVRQDARLLRLAPLVRSVGEWTVQTGYDQKVITFVADEITSIAAKPEMRELIAGFLAKALSVYESEKGRRKLFNSIAGVSPDNMAGFIQQQLVAWLANSKQEDHPLRLKLRQRLTDYLSRLADDPKTAEQLEAWKEKLQSELDIVGLIQRALQWLLQQARQHPQQMAQWFRQVDRLVDQLLADFRVDRQQQQSVCKGLKLAIFGFVDSHHDKIGALVRERLAQFSDEELVAFIEDRVGEDLQFIRVNGSIVGGLTGGVLYCLTFWL